MGRVLQCFLNADLRSGHNGLSILARKHNVLVEDLSTGEYVVFINRARSRLKVYASNNVIAFYAAEDRGSIDLRTVQMIPKVFNGPEGLNYNKALKLAVEKALLDKKSRELQAFSEHKFRLT